MFNGKARLPAAIDRVVFAQGAVKRMRLWALLGTMTMSTRVVASTMSAQPSPLRCDAVSWQRAYASYTSEYSKAEAGDLYKFTHQGIMGSEHAVPDEKSVVAWMDREVAGLATHSEPRGHRAPLVEPLPPSGRYVRVHLRPYLARKGDPATLVRAFIATANGPKGDTAQFACAERGLARMGPSALVTSTIALIRERRAQGFSASHHSAAFEAAYAPAYRVISSDRVKALLADTTQR